MGNTTGELYFGDNLDVLRKNVATERIDLIYLDPPFNSQAQYNVLFPMPREDLESAQAGAFVDMWGWGDEAEAAFRDTMKLGGGVARFIDALRSALGDSSMMAYLAMMAIRLYELHRVLKPEGTLYLHCDPTASHYLKILLDGIFMPSRYRNEISWRRSNPKSHATTNFPNSRDVLLRYSKGELCTFNKVFGKHDPAYLDKAYKYEDENGRYRLLPLLNPNDNRPNLTYEFLGVTRVWRWTRDRMEEAYRSGLVVQLKPGAVPQYKKHLEDSDGRTITNDWDDIKPVHGGEEIGYPTQKPVALLDRIINVSSNKGDTVLDPFCGCGTTVESAGQNERHWIGIDIAIHAMKVIETRIAERLPAGTQYTISGIPKDFASAERLANDNKYQFQWWANYLFNPHALREQKKGADRGIDGELFFPNGPGNPWGRMLTSVKGGTNIGPAMVRDFRGVLERESAEMGLFICLYSPTRAMIAEAAAAGRARTVHGDLPKLQIVALEEWFQGKQPRLPPLEHLPSAVLMSRPRQRGVMRRPDPRAPELPLVFEGGQSSTIKRHINPAMIISRRTAS